MNYKLLIRNIAGKELVETVDWYESRRKGLGGRFLRCVRIALQNIAASPVRYPLICGKIRRASIRRFPYGIYYIVKQSKIYIIAVHHHRRHSDHWQERQ